MRPSLHRRSSGQLVVRVALGLWAVTMAQGCRCEVPDAARVVIDTDVRYQEFEGFGTSINGWSAVLRAHYERAAFGKAFLGELGATVLRVDLHQDVVPERERWEDLSYRDFVLDGVGERGATYLRVAEALTRDSRGSLRVIASVWSPPAWMKVNGSDGNGHPGRKNFALSGADLGIPEAEHEAAQLPDDDTRKRYLLSNKLRRDKYQHFAKSLVEWVRLYRAHGVELYALSPQNEPRFSHWFGSAVYTPKELADVLEGIVQMFEHEGERLPRLFAPETMTHDSQGNQAYLEALFASPLVASHLHALAAHGYVDGYKADQDPESPGRFFQLASRYGKPVWFTEGGTGGHQWPAPLDGIATSMMNALSFGQASLVTPWQVVDEKENEHGLMGLAGPTKKTAIAQQFFRSFRPGMNRVKVTSTDPQIAAVAMAEAPTGGGAPGELAMVLINRSTRARWVQLHAAEGALEVISALVTDRDRTLEPPERQGSSLNLPAASTTSLRVRASPSD